MLKMAKTSYSKLCVVGEGIIWNFLNIYRIGEKEKHLNYQ